MEALTLLKGVTKKYRSSPKAVREFCADCGSQLFFHYTEGPSEVDVSIASLDDPSSIQPTYHIWTSSHILWLTIADDLPRYLDDGKDFSPYK